MVTRIAIAGFGKIARDQHLPAIAANPDFALAAVVSTSGVVPGVPTFPDIAALIADGPRVDAIALCMPPGPRPAAAVAALAAGIDVLLEKPPAATVAAAEAIVAAAGDRVVFAAWHSRFAAGVAAARAVLATRTITGVDVEWREDVRRWHPGQDWIWQADGFGVLDPGINALSILTAILPGRLELAAARLDFPAGRDAPIAARLDLAGGGYGVTCDFDWRSAGADIWRIAIDTTSGPVVLDGGGAQLFLDGAPMTLPPSAEYPGVYRHFTALRARRTGDCDLSPLVIAAAALASGFRTIVSPFED